MFADDPVIDVMTALNDQLIMDMSADEAVGKGPHGVAEDVPADCLHDVLHELRAVGFDPLPFLHGVDTHVGDGLSAEAVLSYFGIYVTEVPT